MLKKKQPSKSFLDISNIYVKGPLQTNSQLVQNFTTRKSERTLDVSSIEDKQKENSYEKIKYCHIPVSKYQRSTSEIFNKSFCNSFVKQHQNDASLNTSTMTPPLAKRFQRKSERKVEIVSFISVQKSDMNKQKRNCQEESITKQPNQLLKQYQALQKQNMKLKETLLEKDRKISLLNSLIKDKDNHLKKTNDNLAQKQNIVKQLEDNVISKSKLIMKLQQKTVQLEIKLSQSKINRTTSNIEAQFTQKMNVLYQRLRYRQMQVHMLKKQVFQYKQIEKKLKIACKQNYQLKERIKYLVKKKYTEEFDRESNSSLSYSCLSFNPDEFARQ